jgi:hypothetical protein
MTADSRPLRGALTYAKRLGFAVFPCRPYGKTPLTDHGFKDASKYPRIVSRWWQKWPQANVAIATGALSDIVVLDVDPRHSGDQSLEDLETKHDRLPETPHVLTGGGGSHFYFRMPAGVEIPSKAGALGPGLDIRADAGYVIAPPSLHVSGARYCWEFSARIHEVPVADLPRWLLKLILSLSPVRHTSAGDRHLPAGRISFQRLAGGIPDGVRDWTLFRLACSLRRQGYSRGFVERVVLDAARRCKPPFPERVVRRKVASAWRYP